MKEIIYIQAGRSANYAGTHFWNTQESYFTYDANSEPVVDHDVSFREGLSSQNETTYCPRALIFDFKSNFGALSRHNDLYQDEPYPEENIWNGATVEHRQGPVAKSEYQRQLEDGGEDEQAEGAGSQNRYEMRYWSDYNRVYYIPRSIQQVPDLPDWGTRDGDWKYGREVFERYEADNNLSDDSLRLFAEECNNLQGFQTSFDNSTFGRFTTSFLEGIRDEYPKLTILAFPELSGIDVTKVDVEDISQRKTCLQDIACLIALDDLAAQSVPLQSATSWQSGNWLKHLNVDKANVYHSSAVLSAHTESATLPLRLKNRREDLSSVCAQLNWTQNTRISHLSGILPFVDTTTPETFDECIYDFSSCVERTETVQYFAQRNITRGLSLGQVYAAEGFFTSTSGLDTPYLTNTHAPSYPLPTSFPPIFASLPSTTSPMRTKTLPTRLLTTALLSSLHTSSRTARALRGYATLLHACAARRLSGDVVAGLEADEVREVEERVWGLVDVYAVDAEGGRDSGEEDEGGSEELDEDEDAL